MRICWIASYPRSGNTWMRLLLHDVLFGPLGSTRDLQQRIPDIHRGITDFKPSRPTTLIKTHHVWRAGHPMAGFTAGFVYLIRDPRDVLLSAMNYVELTGTKVENRVEFVREFIRFGGLPGWVHNGFGGWGDHAASWIGRSTHPRVIVRYEDLLGDPAGQLGRVFAFFGEPVTDEAIEAAVERNRLAALQEREEREKRDEACWFPGSAEQAAEGKRFFNAGRTGQRLDDIAEGLDAEFDARFGKELQAFGYGEGVAGVPADRHARSVG